MMTRSLAILMAVALAGAACRRKPAADVSTAEVRGKVLSANGRARPGARALLAEAPGFGTMQLDRVDVPSRPLTLRLEGESRSLGGIVISNGQGVIGAKVALGGPSLRTPRVAVTGKNGTFMFNGIGQGRYTL